MTPFIYTQISWNDPSLYYSYIQFVNTTEPVIHKVTAIIVIVLDDPNIKGGITLLKKESDDKDMLHIPHIYRVL